MGIERGALGSLLGHSGPVGESERYAARVFGAHRTYSVLNGTSASNRAIMSACVGDDEIALCDRNCHKSIEQGLAITGGIPVFLTPDAQSLRHHRPDSPAAPRARRRSRRASPPIRCAKAAGQQARGLFGAHELHLRRHVLRRRGRARRASRRASTASTSTRPGTATRASIRCTATATRCAAIPATHPKDGPTVFATHSTHKLLAALSQTSFIHIRDGRGAIDHGRFNEAYCSQASTSPLYALIASNDVAAAMMDGPAGQALTQETHRRGRRLPARGGARTRRSSWRRRTGSSRPGMPTRSRDPKTASASRSTKRRAELLATDPNCWVLHPGESWHGFDELPDGWCMLDPIKFGIVCPGMQDDGELADERHPGRHRHRLSRRVTASCRRAPPITWCCSCSRSASPRASGARCSTRCSTSRPTTTATRRSPRCCRGGRGRRRSVTPAWASRISATRCGRICARASRATGRRRRTRRCPRRR